MSNWDDLETRANAAIADTFGAAATLAPQDGSGGWLEAIPISGIKTLPPGDPDPAVLWIWVDLATLSLKPKAGDRIAYGGVSYFVEDRKADSTGSGLTLKLRAP